MTRVQNCSRSWRTSKLASAVPRSRVVRRRCYHRFTAIVTHAAGSLDIAENAYSIRCMSGLYEVEVEPEVRSWLADRRSCLHAQRVCGAEHGQAHEVFDREAS